MIQMLNCCMKLQVVRKYMGAGRIYIYTYRERESEVKSLYLEMFSLACSTVYNRFLDSSLDS